MKKILLFIIAGVVGLGLTSCVQSGESDSVIALRKAKADQLTSMAALNNAQAEAALIAANAQAEYDKAMAAYNLAQAAYEKAMAESQDIKNAQAELALEKAKATLELEIEAATLKAKAEIEKQKAAYERAKADLIAALDGVAAAERARVMTLIDEADLIMGRIFTLTGKLNVERGELALAQNNLLDAETAKAKEIRENEATIDAINYSIKALEDLGNDTYEEIQEAIKKVTAQKDYQDGLTRESEAVWKGSLDAYDAAMAMENTPLYRFWTVNYMAEYENAEGYIRRMDFSGAFKASYVADRMVEFTTWENKTVEDFLMMRSIEDDYSYYTRYIFIEPDASELDRMAQNQEREVAIKQAALDTAQLYHDIALDPAKTPAYKVLVDAVDAAYAQWKIAKNETERQAAQNEINVAEWDLKNYVGNVENIFAPYKID